MSLCHPTPCTLTHTAAPGAHLLSTECSQKHVSRRKQAVLVTRCPLRSPGRSTQGRRGDPCCGFPRALPALLGPTLSCSPLFKCHPQFLLFLMFVHSDFYTILISPEIQMLCVLVFNFSSENGTPVISIFGAGRRLRRSVSFWKGFCGRVWGSDVHSRT